MVLGMDGRKGVFATGDLAVGIILQTTLFQPGSGGKLIDVQPSVGPVDFG
jgi:hypothetical protein